MQSFAVHKPAISDNDLLYNYICTRSTINFNNIPEKMCFNIIDKVPYPLISDLIWQVHFIKPPGRCNWARASATRRHHIKVNNILSREDPRSALCMRNRQTSSLVLE